MQLAQEVTHTRPRPAIASQRSAAKHRSAVLNRDATIMDRVLAYHTAAAKLETPVGPTYEAWHLLLNLMNYCEARDIDFEALVADVRDERPIVLGDLV